MVHSELIGFGPFFSSQLSLEELQSSLVGRAVADRGRSLLVRFPDGGHPVVVPGRLRAEGVLPVAGDFVVASPVPDRAVTRVLERRTSREGVATLATRLRPNRTGVLVGPSGAGKSTLTNALLGRDAQRTAPVRGSDDRGVHTTSHRELFPLPGGGALVDGPGIRELRLWDASGLDAAFEDLAAIGARCRFRDCSHGTEPGCAVREAIAEGHIDAARVESHRKLALEFVRQAERREGGAARAERARWKAISKELRRLSRERRR